MICGTGPFAPAEKRNQIRVSVRSYPLSVFGTSTSRRYQDASPEDSKPGFTNCQLESSRSTLSPWATSPEWNRHSPAGKWFNSLRRLITVCASLGNDLVSCAVCSASCAHTGDEKNMAVAQIVLQATPRPNSVFTCNLLAQDSRVTLAESLSENNGKRRVGLYS